MFLLNASNTLQSSDGLLVAGFINFVYGILLLLGITIFLISRMTKRVLKDFYNGKCSRGLILRAGFCRCVYTALGGLSGKNAGTSADTMRFVSAATYFAMGDYSRFLKSNARIKSTPSYKALGLMLYHLTVSRDISAAKEEYEAVLTDKAAISMEVVHFVKGLLCYEEGRIAEAKVLLGEASPYLHAAVYQRLSTEYLKKVKAVEA